MQSFFLRVANGAPFDFILLRSGQASRTMIRFKRKKLCIYAKLFLKGGQWGSNPRPSVPQTDILTN
jgi:hypothetical protein